MIGGLFIRKRIDAGIITGIKLLRDNRNNTYTSDSDFIKDKDNILDILNRVINIKLFNISTGNNYIYLELKNKIIKRNINNIKKFFIRHRLFKFKYIYNNTNSCIFNNYLDDYLFDDLDVDFNSIYSPIMIETYIIGIYTSDYITIRDYNDILNLLKYYNRVFIKNKLANIIVYGINI